MSPTSTIQSGRRNFYFGVIGLIFVSISLFGTLFLKHPSNDPSVIQLADYLLIMGIVAMIFVIPLGLDKTPPSAVEYNILALPLSFLIGLGFIAFFRALPLDVFIPEMDEFFTVFFQNEELATLTVFGLPTEITMFFVASIEELTFRVAFPLIFMTILSSKEIPSSFQWFGSIACSSILFGVWHIFAYNADTTLIITAMLAGIILAFGYRIGVAAGGCDLAFLGVVIGHYFWNLVMSGIAMSIPAMLSFMIFVVIFVLLLSPKTQKLFMTTIGKYKRGLFR